MGAHATNKRPTSISYFHIHRPIQFQIMPVILPMIFRLISLRHQCTRGVAMLRVWLLLIGVSALMPAPAAAQTLGDHPIRMDAQGAILPWYSDDPATMYDFDLHKVWDWWRELPVCCDGQKNYMVSRVWDESYTNYGVGGDQFAMALSSWAKLYAYTGDRRIVENMQYIADTYLQNSLSDQSSLWPGIPYPCNMTPLAIYDGDLVAGPGFTQPDKAGSFGAELITLYKITGNSKYLDAATAIANTLSAHITPGDSLNSPLPFRVRASDGEVFDNYTTNWAGTMRLFSGLIELGIGSHENYSTANDLLMQWLLDYPVQTNDWGPFYEDVEGWSNTQINPCALVRYILQHPTSDSNWRSHARMILDQTYERFADSSISDLGVFPIFEQTVYMVPGNSHTADFASAELLYAERTGDTSRVAAAVRQLNWATYMVDSDGKNRYPTDSVWYTDGYGDYVRYYLDAMASDPILAPVDMPHILRSSSTISNVTYSTDSINYATFDSNSTELLRMPKPPSRVVAGNTPLSLVAWPDSGELRLEGWAWRALASGGIVQLHKSKSTTVGISFQTMGVQTASDRALQLRTTSHNSIIVSGLVAGRPYRVQIMNLLGVAIAERDVESSGSTSELALPASAAGMYVIRISQAGVSVTQRVLLTALQ